MFKTFRSFIEDESGATAIEYGLIAALVSVAAIGALSAMGTTLSDLLGAVAGEISNAVANRG